MGAERTIGSHYRLRDPLVEEPLDAVASAAMRFCLSFSRARAPPAKSTPSMLQAIWPAIVGAEPKKFALIHCLAGPSAGVWFHLLPNADYEAGCLEVQSL